METLKAKGNSTMFQKCFIGILIAVLLAGCCLSACSHQEAAGESNLSESETASEVLTNATVAAHYSLSVGDSAPDFTVTLTDGSTYTLSEHADETVFMNFWASWCQPCCRELPDINRLAEEGYHVITVNCSENVETVKAFLLENDYTFPVIADENATVQSLYISNGIPYSLIIKNAVIQNTFLGLPDNPYEKYKEAIEAVQ